MAGKNLFNSVLMSSPNRNVFDLTHDVKFSCNMGTLIPTMFLDCIPNDSFSIGCESIVRFAPLIAPVMHRFDVYMHYWFVPYRLLWHNSDRSFEKWITNDTVGRTFPFIMTGPNSGQAKIQDYFGIPLYGECAPATDDVSITAMPFAAYQMIYNQFYRDQNLVTTGLYDDEAGLVDGDNTATPFLFQLRQRAWEHDYLTSCLPFAQKGSAVSLPLGTFPDVKVFEQNAAAFAAGDTLAVIQPVGAPNTPVKKTPITNTADTAHWDIKDRAALHGDEEGMYADTSSLVAGAATINDLRKAFRLQEYLEKLARGGSRYAEFIRSFFGVTPEDARLQRPEYITGTKSPVIISEVLNTAGTFDPATPTDPSSPPQGNMAGHGVGVTAGKYGNYHCKEHGCIIGIMSIMPKTAYQQGIARKWLKINNPYEYFTPQFANIGEQEVYNDEVYAFSSVGKETFGYLPRYAEYRFEANRVAGDFRTGLNYWHAGRIFASRPSLNAQFVSADPTDRIFAVTDPSTDHMYVQILHRVKAIRPIPKYGVPSF